MARITFAKTAGGMYHLTSDGGLDIMGATLEDVLMEAVEQKGGLGGPFYAEDAEDILLFLMEDTQ